MERLLTTNLYFGDCFSLVPKYIADQSVDLLFTDPPYGITQNSWDRQLDLESFWKMVRRVLKPLGVVAVFSAQPFTSHLLLSNEEDFKYEWVLHKTKKTGHLNASKMPLRSHESVLIFAKPGHLYQPQMTYGHKPVNSFTKKKNSDGTNYGATRVVSGGGQTTRYPESVLNVPWIGSTSPERCGHPQQKPVACCRYFIETYTKPGMFVVDTFMGSGSAGVACENTYRNFAGFENDKSYFDKAVKRLPHGRVTT